MKKEIYMTKGQLQKVQEEYEYYIHEKRPEIVARIKEAKSFGDLSENSEYDSAREEQAFVEAKIKDLETMISNAILIEEHVESDVVVLGTIVTYENIDTKEKHTYKIVGVGSEPLNPEQPSISTSTPIARALFGKGVGEMIETEVPSGKLKLKILKVE